MKKLTIFPMLLLAACTLKSPNSHDGIYTRHFDNDIAIGEDTITVQDTILVNHYSYRRIKKGTLGPKLYKTERLFEQHPQFQNGHMILNGYTYEKH